MTISSGPERPQGVFDRLERIGVADLAVRGEPRLAELGQARVETLLRGARAGSSSDARCCSGDGCAGATTSTFVAVALALLPDHRVQRLARDRLVRDHEDAPLVVRVRERRRNARRRLVAPAQEGEVDGDERQHDEHRDAEPHVDDRADHDQREVADRQQQEPKRLGLAAKRIPHVPSSDLFQRR